MKNVKRILVALMALLLVSGMVFAQGGAESGAQVQKVSIKAANAAQDGDSLDSAMDYLVKALNEASNGNSTGSVFPNSQLGGHDDFIGGLQMGSIQIAEATAAVLSSVAPKFAVFDLPYVAPNSAEAVYQLLQGEAGEILNNDLIENADLRVIGWMARTPRHVYSAVGPINSIEDWDGLKIRTMMSTPMVEAMKLLGARATPIATAERYLALQTGVVEAAENNVAEIYNCKEYEVTDYLSKTGHLCAPNVLFVSEKWFQSLSEENKALVLEYGEKAGRMASDTDINLEKDFESKLASEGGMIVNEIEDTAQFQKALAPLYEKYRDVVGADLLALFQAN